MRPKHIKALARAVREAEGWRGALVGNPDPAPLEEFDAFIATAKEAIKVLRRQEAEQKAEQKAKVPHV